MWLGYDKSGVDDETKYATGCEQYYIFNITR